ncbi:MAG: DUF1559 domain-containing protein [Pirellulales bacterium]|nr:DUF1559 domain-containing protein [Pirellulales bacterium]
MAVMGMPSFIEMFMMMVFSGVGLPLGIPPAPENPVMSNIAPEQCLAFTTWAAMAKPDGASDNQTEQLLAEPEVKRMVDAIKKTIDKTVAGPPGMAGQMRPSMMWSQVAYPWFETVLTHSGTIFVEKVELGEMGIPNIQGGCVIDAGEDAAKIKAMFEKLETRMLQMEFFSKDVPDGVVKRVQIDGSTWYRSTKNPMGMTLTFGMKDNFVILGLGDGAVEGILQRMKTPPPAWLTELRSQVPVKRVSTITYIDFAGLVAKFGPMAPTEIRAALHAMGFANVTKITSVTGLDKLGFVNRTLLSIDGKPQGLLALTDAKPLTTDDLDAIPADATLALVVRADADAVLEAILGVVAAVERRGVKEFERGMAEMKQATGVDLREDLLKPLGDTWRIYNSPGEGGLVFTGLTAVVSVDDMEKLSAANRMMVTFARIAMQNGPPRRQPRIEQFKFADREVYYFNARDDDFPLAPAWCLTDKELIVAPLPQNIKAYLSRDAGSQRLGSVPEVKAALGDSEGPLVLGYCDTPKIFDLVYPIVPFFAQSMFSDLSRYQGIDLTVDMLPSTPAIRKHLRPAVTTIRRTEQGIEFISRQTLPSAGVGIVPWFMFASAPAIPARRISGMRDQSQNNLKQIAIAMHNFHDARKRFPAGYTVDKDKKPLLSWRVAILPYLEENDLYNQFHLDEPWDSPHNKPLIAKMPNVYRAPGSQAAQGRTNYLTVRGKKTAFPGSDRIAIRNITDGTSNTIMTVEVSDAKAVPWTKPDDFEYKEDNPVAGLVGLRPGGFLAGFCDGSVQFLPAALPKASLNAYFTRNGREPTSQLDHGEYDQPRAYPQPVHPGGMGGGVF